MVSHLTKNPNLSVLVFSYLLESLNIFDGLIVRFFSYLLTGKSGIEEVRKYPARPPEEATGFETDTGERLSIPLCKFNCSLFD